METRTVEAMKLRRLFIIFVFVMVSTIEAHIVDFDEVWQQRAEEAKKATRQAHHPNPLNVANHLNKHVHKYLSLFLSHSSMAIVASDLAS